MNVIFPLTWRNRLRLIRLALTLKDRASFPIQPPQSPLDPYRVPIPTVPILSLPNGTPPPPGLTGTKIIVRIIGRRSLNSAVGSEEHTLNLTIPITAAEFIAPALCLATKVALTHTTLDPTLIQSTQLTIHKN